MNDIRTLIRTDMAILRNVRDILALASCNTREASLSRDQDPDFVNKAKASVGCLDAAMDEIDNAIGWLDPEVNPEYDIVDDPEPHGARDTFVPHPTNPPTCDSCSHDLELNAEFRCVRCGAQS